MKTRLLLACCLSASIIGAASARTWTSSDGQQTFEGDYVTSTSDEVTVLKNGSKLTFPISKLSEDDQDWIKEAAAKAEAEKVSAELAESFGDSELGKFLKKTKKFDGRKYKKAPLESIPQYFILYFSASW